MMIEPAPKKTRSWLKIIAVILALVGVGFVLFLKNKMPADRFKKENTSKSKAN